MVETQRLGVQGHPRLLTKSGPSLSYRDGLVVKNIYYSPRGSEFSSQQSRQDAHNSLKLWLQGIQHPLLASSMCTNPQRHIYIIYKK